MLELRLCATATVTRSSASSAASSSPVPARRSRRYPLGNTGGADVSAVTPMPVPADLTAVLGLG